MFANLACKIDKRCRHPGGRGRGVAGRKGLKKILFILSKYRGLVDVFYFRQINGNGGQILGWGGGKS